MKGDLMVGFLEVLEGSVSSIPELLVIFTSPYSSSMRGIDYRLSQFRRRRNAAQFETIKKRAFYDLIYRLERDGLITRTKGKDSETHLTAIGKKLLRLLKQRNGKRLSVKKYPKETENVLKIIIFDIPERQKQKRDWLRSVLVHLGFNKLQKSVWIGKAKIPGELLDDLRRFDLLSCVEILAVTKTGSLKPIQPTR